MEFVIGLLSGVVFFAVVLFSVYIGYRLGRKKSKPPDKNDEELRKATKLHEDFMQLMNYNENVALQRKKVD